MKAVIMVGGLGTRLRPYTEHTPKPLLPLGGKPLLRITLEHLKSCGVTEVFLATNYKAEMFEAEFGDGSDLGIRIHYSLETEPLGTAGPLSLIKDELLSSEEPFLVLNGDLLIDTDLREMVAFHERHNAVFTIGTRVVTFPTEYGKVETEGDRVTGLVEKPNLSVEISGGVYVLEPVLLKRLPQSRCLMTDFIRDLIVDDFLVVKYRMPGMWLDVGRVADYETAQEHVLQRQRV